jgi:hypothetical protein
MVSIVIPKNSLTDLINAGLTVKYYAKKGESSKICLIDEDEKETFWSELQKYADDDRALIILNFPVSSDETLKAMPVEPYEYSILYVPSETLAVTVQTKKILFEKGIITMPQRSIYKCFPGDYTGVVEKKWMELSKIISFEKEVKPSDKKTIHILIGLLKTMENEPLLAISRIAKDDECFFEKIGEAEPTPQVAKHISHKNLEMVFLAKAKPALEPNILQTAFLHSVHFRNNPLSIKGNAESVVLIDAPTFAYQVFHDHKVKPKSQIRLGKRTAIFTENIEAAEMGAIVSRLSQRNILIKITGRPKFVVGKTLTRRLIGGKGPKGRFYRGIKEEYPELALNNNIISTPRSAFEVVIETLKETGAKYEIIE